MQRFSSRLHTVCESAVYKTDGVIETKYGIADITLVSLLWLLVAPGRWDMWCPHAAVFDPSYEMKQI